MRAVVGEPDSISGELVIAILRSASSEAFYFVCTPNHGVVSGRPIQVGLDDPSQVVCFEDDVTPHEVAGVMAHEVDGVIPQEVDGFTQQKVAHPVEVVAVESESAHALETLRWAFGG
jgi:hypothetical protein